MLQRASAVMSGDWLGVFDFLCRGFLRKRRVVMMFGSHAFHLATFAPLLFPPGGQHQFAYVIACKISEDGELYSALKSATVCFPTINHYVIGLPNEQASATVDLTKTSVSPETSQPAVWEKMSDAALRGGSYQ